MNKQNPPSYTNLLVVALFTTRKEYKSGLIHRMLQQYLSKKPSSQFSFDWHIVFDQGEEKDYKDLLNFSNHQNIKNIFIHSLRIKDKDNFYSREYRPDYLMLEHERLGKPWLGNTCGANNLFFNGMDYMQMQNYKNILLLESDTQPLKNLWFDSLLEKCEYEIFLIMGSVYKGNQVINDPSGIIQNHLNGVAIYKNCVELSVILKDAKIFILNETRMSYIALKTEGHTLKDLTFYMNYDISIYHQSQSQKYKKYKSLFKNCEFITNTSLPKDADISIKEIKAKYPQTIILHKKPSLKDQQTLLPVYYHIAKNAGTYVLSSIKFLLEAYTEEKPHEEDWIHVQCAINFSSGNRCTLFAGLKNSGINDLHELNHHVEAALDNYEYLSDNLKDCDIDYLHELSYHAEIASQPYNELDIGETYPNNFKSEFSDLEYARRLRDNALTALREKFPNSKTYEEYKDNKKTILGQIAINSLIKEFPEANTLDFCKKLHKEIIPSEIEKITEQSFSPEEFISFIHSNELLVFAVLVEPRNSGSSFVESELIDWEDNLNFINQICIAHNRKPINFCTLREPFSRAASLFNYVKSSDSDHEFITGGSEVCDFFDIKSETFEEYIETEELEDSWFIRQLLSLSYNQPITEESATLAINKLKDFKIKDITQVDSLIEEIFSKSYNLSFFNLLESNRDYKLNKHQSTQNKTLQFDQLSLELQQKFLDRTRWDRKVYNHFIS